MDVFRCCEASNSKPSHVAEKLELGIFSETSTVAFAPFCLRLAGLTCWPGSPSKQKQILFCRINS